MTAVRFSRSVEGTSYGDGATTWFTEALGIPCTLVRKEAKTLRSRGRPSPWLMGDNNNVSHEMSFANEGQFLLLSKSSVDELNRRVMAELEEGGFRVYLYDPYSCIAYLDCVEYL